jgi:hypothetical protein
MEVKTFLIAPLEKHTYPSVHACVCAHDIGPFKEGAVKACCIDGCYHIIAAKCEAIFDKMNSIIAL